MTTKKEEKAPVDPMDQRSEYDHKTQTLREPQAGDEPRVERKQVDAVLDPKLFDDEEEANGPVPRRGDPFAHQRDTKAAEAGAKQEEKESEQARKKAEAEKK